jgi:hypothetical protein
MHEDVEAGTIRTVTRQSTAGSTCLRLIRSKVTSGANDKRVGTNLGRQQVELAGVTHNLEVPH